MPIVPGVIGFRAGGGGDTVVKVGEIVVTVSSPNIVAVVSDPAVVAIVKPDDIVVPVDQG